MSCSVEKTAGAADGADDDVTLTAALLRFSSSAASFRISGTLRTGTPKPQGDKSIQLLGVFLFFIDSDYRCGCLNLSN